MDRWSVVNSTGCTHSRTLKWPHFRPRDRRRPSRGLPYDFRVVVLSTVKSNAITVHGRGACIITRTYVTLRYSLRWHWRIANDRTLPPRRQSENSRLKLVGYFSLKAFFCAFFVEKWEFCTQKYHSIKIKLWIKATFSQLALNRHFRLIRMQCTACNIVQCSASAHCRKLL